MQKFDRAFLANVLALSKPYWFSEEKHSARILLASLIAVNLAIVYLSVLLNEWSASFFNALQDFNVSEFWRQLAFFGVLASFHVVGSVISLILGQTLKMRWRRWMTNRFTKAWLANQSYYRLRFTDAADTDNPDQRISDDIGLFTDKTVSLFVGVIDTVVSLCCFVTILWRLSGAIHFGGYAIPGYLVWIALGYAAIGTIVTHRIGNPLTGLYYEQQRREADFRFGLVRLRENGESVAFFRGEAHEAAALQSTFGDVVNNFWRLLWRQQGLSWFTASYNQISVVVPFLASAPRYLSHSIQLGGLMQITSAFGSVQACLSYIVNSYGEIAGWRAVTHRLASFATILDKMEREPVSHLVIEQGPGLTVENVDIDLPDGTALLRTVSLAVRHGRALLITGRSGIGKSTLLRSLAGIWPFAAGTVRMENKTMFVPQRPYIPIGTLRDAAFYPRKPPQLYNDHILRTLREVGLDHLIPELDSIDNWGHRLSLGEQQRLSFARVLLNTPKVVFLDEATSALDEAMEAKLYRMLREQPWIEAIVSVGHRGTLRQFHDEEYDIGQGAHRQSS